MDRYAHMCRSDHVEIGHNDSEHELCPLCRMQNERDALAEKVMTTYDKDMAIQELIKALQRWLPSSQIDIPDWADEYRKWLDHDWSLLSKYNRGARHEND